MIRTGGCHCGQVRYTVELPDPLTPVTATNSPSGNSTVTFRRLFARAPWTVILSDDKLRTRICAIQNILLAVDFKGKDLEVIGKIDEKICGGPAIRPKG